MRLKIRSGTYKRNSEKKWGVRTKFFLRETFWKILRAKRCEIFGSSGARIRANEKQENREERVEEGRKRRELTPKRKSLDSDRSRIVINNSFPAVRTSCSQPSPAACTLTAQGVLGHRHTGEMANGVKKIIVTFRNRISTKMSMFHRMAFPIELPARPPESARSVGVAGASLLL
ncbi:hypothetical protein EVAR_11870_1 [Eumeta japonica]|uniref:Uncharacterized protein n=1 Tax=Eumeta variegata TaxID=151549 RepID=A0A4C1U8U4_EUMVA|nr:hypothetical protein EVAR_11870_1 [Eumeta japonica]